jgi:DNA repair exonuclease SbcCD ATPase subunit
MAASQTKYSCSLCGTNYKNNQGYKRHLKTKKHLKKESNRSESKESQVVIPEVQPEVEVTVEPIVLPDLLQIELKADERKIEFLYHLSDIHIHCDKRHDEYRDVFSRFLQNVDKNHKDNSVPLSRSAFVITGDYLDNKNRITPEEVVLAREFILELAHRAPTFIIAGNHDKNLHFSQKEDNITAVVSNGSFETKNVHYLKHTGIYRYNNITFGVSSVFDYRAVPITEVPENQYRIALFHGGVGKYVLYNGTSNTKEKTRPVSSFNGYDFTLLGDIHKWQFLDTSRRVAYAGSMLQKNHGEAWSDHGYLLWNLKTKQVVHTPIQNDYRFVTLNILDGKLMSSLDNLPRHLYVRWDIKETGAQTSEEGVSPSKVQEDVRSRFSVEEEKYCHSAFLPEAMYQEGPKTSFDLSVEKQAEYAEAWLQSESKTVTPEDLEQLKDLSGIYNDKIKENIPPVVNWRLIDLEFENVFCYEEKQRIIFEGMKGVNGIVAHNNAGKSAIFDILLFTLFGKCTRSDVYSFGDLVHVPNNNDGNVVDERVLRCSISFRTVEGGDVYKIIRCCTKDRGSMLVTIEKNQVRQYHGSGRDGNAMIMKMIGNYEDFMTTTVLAQHSIHNFLLMTGKSQKEFTGRIFRLDLYDKIHKLAKKDLKSKMLEQKVASKTVDDLQAEKPEEVKETAEKELRSVLIERKALRENRDQHNESKRLLEEKIAPLLPNEPISELHQLQTRKKLLLDKLEKVELEQLTLLQNYEEHNAFETSVEDELKKVEKLLAETTVQEDASYKHNLTELLTDGEKLRVKLKGLRGKKSKESKIVFSLKQCLEKQIEFNKEMERSTKFIAEKEEYLEEVKNVTVESVDKKRQELMNKLKQIPAEPTEDVFESVRSHFTSGDMVENVESKLKEMMESNKLFRFLAIAVAKFDFEHIDPMPEECGVWCSNLYDLFKKTKQPLRREAVWENKKFNEEKERLVDMLHKQKALVKEIQTIEETKEKLKDHRYDPNCKFCCENPFVRKAELRIAKEDETKTELVRLGSQIELLDLAINAQVVLQERDRQLKLFEDSTESSQKYVDDLQLCLSKHEKAEVLREEIKQKRKEIAGLETETKELEEKWAAKQKCLLSLEKVKNSAQSLMRTATDLASLLETYQWIQEENRKIREKQPEIIERVKTLKSVISLREEQKQLQEKVEETEEHIKIKFRNNEAREQNKAIQEQINVLMIGIKDLEYKDSKAQRSEVELVVRIEHQQTLIDRLRKTERELRVLKKETDLLSLLVSMSHHNGIPAFLLRRITKQMEETVNEILTQYSKMKVKVRNEGKETVIRVKIPGKTSDLNAKMLCGSEKFLVELAFRVTFQVLSNVSKPNFMVCDEGWSCLDEGARAKLRFLLSALLEHNEYILTVSHINDVKAWMTKAISIEIGEDGSHRVKQ